MSLRASIVTLGVALAAWAAPIASTYAEDAVAHAEACTTWGFIQDINYEFGVVNTCEHPIEVWFLSGSGAEANGQAAPGAVFSTGLTTVTADINMWVAATCRAGYRPSIRLSFEPADAIQRSQYNCIRV
jgi:hypothetical protein